MSHLVFELHVTLPYFTLLVGLGNFREESVEYEVMILNAVAYREVLSEITFRENTSNQGILTENYKLVTDSGSINAFVISSKFTGSQFLGIEHAIGVQIGIAFLQRARESASLFTERSTFCVFIPSSKRSCSCRISSNTVPTIGHGKHRIFDAKQELRAICRTCKTGSGSGYRLNRTIFSGTILHRVDQALYGLSKLYNVGTGCRSLSSLHYRLFFSILSCILAWINNTIQNTLYLIHLLLSDRSICSSMSCHVGG